MSEIKESEEILKERFDIIKRFYSDGEIVLEEMQISILKEMFGKNFLTSQYFLKNIEFIYG